MHTRARLGYQDAQREAESMGGEVQNAVEISIHGVFFF